MLPLAGGHGLTRKHQVNRIAAEVCQCRRNAVRRADAHTEQIYSWGGDCEFEIE